MSILKYSALELNKLIIKKSISALEVMVALEAHIDRTEPTTRAFVYMDTEKAKRAAAGIDKMLRENKILSPLAGVPFALKANMATINEPTNACSAILADFKPGYDSVVAGKLAEEGAICIGKTNMDALAMGSSTATSYFGPSYNPWGENLSPGGSAAAVAAKEAWFALGSDTGGSIRQPAAFCGLVGMKPTFGLVSAFGIVPLAPTLDQVGPITRNIADCAAVMSVISKNNLGFSEGLNKPIKGLRIAVPKEYMELAEPEIEKAVRDALNVYKSLGASVYEISLPHTKYALPAYHVLAPANLANLLSGDDYPDCPGFVATMKAYDTGLFGMEERRRLMMGYYFNSKLDREEYYLQACKIRRVIKDEFEAAFEKYDCIITPTTCGTAFRYDNAPTAGKEMYQNDMLLAPASIAGIPAVSIPCGIVNDLPVAMQIMSRAFNDKAILKIAYAYEAAIKQ